MVNVRRRKRRVLRSPTTNERVTPREPGPVYSTPTMRIMALPHYSRVVESLSRGVSVPSIVQWFEREGWLGTMSPSTLTQYLYKFKVERSELLKEPSDTSQSYDAQVGVGTNIPDVDEGTELDKLILLQKRRLSTEVQTELSIGKLLDGTHKEIAVMGELLKTKRAMRNGLKQQDTQLGDNTSLREMRVSEDAQDRMQGLTTALFKSIKEKQNGKATKARKTQKVKV